MQKLKEHVGSSITELRRQGMEIGIVLKDAETAKKVIDTAFKKGLHIVIGSENNLQIMPPLTIPQELLDKGLEILVSALSDL